MIISVSFPTPPFSLFLFSTPVPLSCPSSVIRWHIWQRADLFVSCFSCGVNSSVTNSLLHTLRWSRPLFRETETKMTDREKRGTEKSIWFHVNRGDSRGLSSVQVWHTHSRPSVHPLTALVHVNLQLTMRVVCLCLCQYLPCSGSVSHDYLINTQ